MYTNYLSASHFFYWWHTFFAGTFCRTLVLKAFRPGNTVSVGDRFQQGLFCLDHFWPGIRFVKKSFSQAAVVSCQIIRHGLIREGAFTKGESNMALVVLGALAPGLVGSGWDFWTVKMCGNYAAFRKIVCTSFIQKSLHQDWLRGIVWGSKVDQMRGNGNIFFYFTYRAYETLK